MALQGWYIDMGGWNYAWKAGEEKYKEIASTVGIKKIENGTDKLVWGAQKPKPLRVRLNFETPARGPTPGAQIIFISKNKLDDVLGGKLKGKKSNGKKIDNVSLC